MKRPIAAGSLAVLAVLAGCGQEAAPVAVSSDPVPSAPAPTEWQAVTIAEGRTRMDVLGTDTLTLIDRRAVAAGLRRQAVGRETLRFTELPNVVYHVLEGEARLVVGTDTAAVAPGVTAFVRGREERAFLDVEEDLLVLSLQTNARPGLDDPALAVFTRDELLEARSPTRNVLYRAVQAESMTLGAFMLSREIGGDLLVRHGVDELKYVLRGGGTIVAGPDVVPVEAGYVVFVDGSLTHRFTRLWRDLDVLFVWAR